MSERQSIVLGGGCFWCLEAVYQQISGVWSVLPGYSGGSSDTANYSDVCTGQTKHAEVVEVIFDPALITLKDIMGVFWLIHDPTSLNQQGADVGTQYASVVYYYDESQLKVVAESRDEAQLLLDQPIVTRLEPLRGFYPAEKEHRDYYKTHPEAGYCRAVIDPKLSKLRAHFAPLLSA